MGSGTGFTLVPIREDIPNELHVVRLEPASMASPNSSRLAHPSAMLVGLIDLLRDLTIFVAQKISAKHD